jgi:hypothetical protein
MMASDAGGLCGCKIAESLTHSLRCAGAMTVKKRGGREIFTFKCDLAVR